VTEEALQAIEALHEHQMPLVGPTGHLAVTWARIHKGDKRGRVLADAHYTRQSIGHPMWTRPGYNFCLYADYADYGEGCAVWVWWRPKWEDGRPGTKRKDGLRVLECTLFRRTGLTPLASTLIATAVAALHTPAARSDLHLDAAGRVDGLITGIGAAKTRRGRSSKSKPGACFRHAGWTEMDKAGGRADVWLESPWSNPHEAGEAHTILDPQRESTP